MHALSRCQMVLTEARRRAQTEFEEVMAQTGLDLDTARERLEAIPETASAGWRVPHCGATGTAANMLLHLAGTRYRHATTAVAKPAPTPTPLEPAVSIPVSFDYGGMCAPCIPCRPCVPEPRPSS